MGYVVKLGPKPGEGPPPAAPAAKGKKPAAERQSLQMELDPKVLGVIAGVVLLVGLGIWFAFGRGGGSSSGNMPATYAPPIPGPGGLTVPSPGGGPPIPGPGSVPGGAKGQGPAVPAPGGGIPAPGPGAPSPGGFGSGGGPPIPGPPGR